MFYLYISSVSSSMYSGYSVRVIGVLLTSSGWNVVLIPVLVLVHSKQQNNLKNCFSWKFQLLDFVLERVQIIYNRQLDGNLVFRLLDVSDCKTQKI